MARDTEKRAAYMKAYRATDEYREKARLRMEAKRSTPAYQQWLEKSQEYRKEKKAEYRRAEGKKTRDEINAEAKAKKAEQELRRAMQQRVKNEFVGPPKPNQKTANGYRTRYRFDNEFSESERHRQQRRKQQLPDSYVRQMLGMKEAPPELIEVKRIQILITRELRNIK